MPIEFACPTCRQPVRTPDAAAGKKGKCPSCGSIVQIPSGNPDSTPKVQSKSATGTPAQVKHSKSKWKEGPPSGDIGPAAGAAETTWMEHITPTQATPPSGAFKGAPISKSSTPAPVAPAPPPLPIDPLAGLAPLPADLLADLSQRSGENPFALGAYIRPPRRPRLVVSDRDRRGLDWERYPSLEAFSDTVLEVVSSPAEAFAKMRRTGGIGNPLGFLTVSSVLGQLLLLIEFFLLFGGFLLLAQWQIIDLIDLGVDNLQVTWETFFILFGAAALLLIPAAVMFASLGGFFSAIMFHIALLICGAANAGFEATYRVVSFGIGSVYMLLPIPIVGPMFAFVMQPLVLIYGFMFAHETDGWRALIAVVMLPLVAAFFVFIIAMALGPTTVAPAGP